MIIDVKNKAFAASLLFRGIRNNNPSEEDLWEESIVLISAEDEEDAAQKAEKIGRENETSYKAMDGSILAWKFVQIERLYEIMDSKITDGTEVFSRYLKNSEVESILSPFDD
ncbi:MAG: DUF4288 domain-containing protein [Azoarcus sp.]|jgi:hypothetical protein|nr:DUF4288 domain-containing protein [Azoarcus sp.]